MFKEFFATSKHTSDICANADVVLAAGLGSQHGVVADDVANIEFGQVKTVREFGDYLVADESNFILRIKQSGDEH
jgi:fructose/tagatose bisphosphate aldolase